MIKTHKDKHLLACEICGSLTKDRAETRIDESGVWREIPICSDCCPLFDNFELVDDWKMSD